MAGDLGAKASTRRHLAYACPCRKTGSHFSGTCAGWPSAAAQLGETLEVAPFRHLGRPGREVIAFDGGGEFGRGTEEPARFARGKSGEPRRLEIGGGAVRRLDHRDEL